MRGHVRGACAFACHVRGTCGTTCAWGMCVCAWALGSAMCLHATTFVCFANLASPARFLLGPEPSTQFRLSDKMHKMVRALISKSEVGPARKPRVLSSFKPGDQQHKSVRTGSPERQSRMSFLPRICSRGPAGYLFCIAARAPA